MTIYFFSRLGQSSAPNTPNKICMSNVNLHLLNAIYRLMHRKYTKIHCFLKFKCFPDFIIIKFKTVTITNIPKQLYLLTNPYNGILFSST